MIVKLTAGKEIKANSELQVNCPEHGEILCYVDANHSAFCPECLNEALEKAEFIYAPLAGIHIQDMPEYDEYIRRRKMNNDRKAYILRRNKTETEYELKYELIPFLDLKKGDIFVLTEPEGNPIPNLDGSVASVATDDAYENDKGVWCITCDSITEVQV